ncbi:hypothetical protein ST47_g9562 [Ascochyta rabiei]|uniref:Uncharacterized protein n=1 Tax=Didymella rabiei TaxID=5454 RepID=A0A162X032_DIDRA|nr:hypothetical protein ST47_g9562 [Ascochyta rabiei]
MVDRNNTLSSALSLIKRFEDDWMQVSDSIDCDGLAALVDILDRLKKDAEQKLSIKKATQASAEPDWEPTHKGSANQGIRRSHRIASAPRFASAGSLFVTEHDTESESSNEDDIPSTMLHEASPNEHTTIIAASGILSDDLELFPVHYEDQAPIEELYGTEMPRESQPIEQMPPSPRLYTPRPVVDRQDQRTEVQPMQDIDGASNAQDHTDTQYQAAHDLDFMERPESLHHSLVNHPHLDATISPFDDFNFGDAVMPDFPSPQFFNDAFEDYRLSSLHHESQTDVEEATAYLDEQYLINQDHTEDFRDDPIVQGYVDLACRSSFRLPHEPVEDADHLDALELLLPLVEERPLTSRLIHGLIYMLLPGPLRIFEVCLFDPEPLPEENLVEDFVAIIRRNEKALPLLVLGVEISKTLYILDSETVDLPSLGTSWLMGPEWRTEHIDPRCIEPDVESTLLSVWIAEAYFQYRPLQNVPSSRDLRLRFLGELLAPYQRDSVLEKCGIPRTQVQTHEIFVPKLENFEPEALRKALLQKPSEINRGRCLRILQCVDEIGSSHILESLKLACARKDEDQIYQAVEQPLFEKLFHIHIYLDKQESQSHLLVARERYIKYCYFETYLRAVKALQEEKRNSYRERRRVSARKRRATFKQVISEELPPTPHTQEIHQVYENLSPSGRKRRALDMVKDEIASKVEKVYRGLLVLFPSFGANPPSLGMDEFGLELQELEEKTLSKPIEMKDIDELRLVEAAWFGEALQARTGLLEQVPKTVFDLISNSLTHDLDLQERDVDSFRDRPLHFFT